MDIRNLSRKDQIIVVDHLYNLERKRHNEAATYHKNRVSLEDAEKPIPKPSLLIYIILTPILAAITPLWLITMFDEDYTLGWYPAIVVLIVGAFLCLRSYYKYYSMKEKNEKDRTNKIRSCECALTLSKTVLNDTNTEIKKYISGYAIPLDCCSEWGYKFILEKLRTTNLPINEIFNLYSKQKAINAIKSDMCDIIDEAKEVQKESDRRARAEAEERKKHNEETRRILTEIRDTQNNIDRYNRYGY